MEGFIIYHGINTDRNDFNESQFIEIDKLLPSNIAPILQKQKTLST